LETDTTDESIVTFASNYVASVAPGECAGFANAVTEQQHRLHKTNLVTLSFDQLGRGCQPCARLAVPFTNSFILRGSRGSLPTRFRRLAVIPRQQGIVGIHSHSTRTPKQLLTKQPICLTLNAL